MFRSLAPLILSLALLATLSGCIVVDGHGHGGKHFAPGKFKKHH